MSEFTLIRNNITIKDEDGNTLISAPVLDLYYTISNCFIGNENAPVKHTMQLAAQQLNTDYGTNLSWGEVADLLDELHDRMEQIKKKRTSTPE